MRRALPFLALVVALYVLAPLVVAALFARGAPVIPSDTAQGSVAGAVETDPALLGAPQKGAGPGPSSASSSPTMAPSGEAGDGPLETLGTSGAPHPTGGIGDPATFWKPGYQPTPRVVVSKGTGGWASFYDDGPGIYVALPGWTRDSPIRTVVVCANVGLWRCATANVWTSCGCHTNTDHPKIVDLSPDLMALITGWDRATMTNRGVVRVTLQLIGGKP